MKVIQAPTLLARTRDKIHGICNADGTTAPNGLAAIAGGSTLNCADSSDPVYTVVGVGSNGFQVTIHNSQTCLNELRSRYTGN